MGDVQHRFACWNRLKRANYNCFCFGLIEVKVLIVVAHLGGFTCADSSGRIDQTDRQTETPAGQTPSCATTIEIIYSPVWSVQRETTRDANQAALAQQAILSQPLSTRWKWPKIGCATRMMFQALSLLGKTYKEIKRNFLSRALRNLRERKNNK